MSRYRYDAFGKRNAASTGPDPVGKQRTFQGRPHDDGIGLTNFRNRMYDPETGRFTQWDKVEDDGNWGNPFNFGDCDAVNRADPIGTGFWEWARDVWKHEIKPITIDLPVFVTKKVGATAYDTGAGALALTTKAGRRGAVRRLEHNVYYETFSREQAHLERATENALRSGSSGSSALIQATGLAVSDMFGATTFSEGTWLKVDTERLVATGDITELSGWERASRAATGVGRVAGTTALVAGMVSPKPAALPKAPTGGPEAHSAVQAKMLAQRLALQEATGMSAPEAVAAVEATRGAEAALVIRAARASAARAPRTPMTKTGTALRAPAASSTGPGIPRIVAQDGNVVEIVAQLPEGKITVIAEMSKKGEILRLTGAHIDGPGPGSVGLSRLRALAKSFGKQQGVKKVIIEGGQRTTGAMIGKTPRPIEVRVE